MGTLLNTEPAILKSYRELFKKYRTEEEFTRDKQLAVLGPSLQTMFAQYFPEQDAEQLVKEYREHNRAAHARSGQADGRSGRAAGKFKSAGL